MKEYKLKLHKNVTAPFLDNVSPRQYSSYKEAMSFDGGTLTIDSTALNIKRKDGSVFQSDLSHCESDAITETYTGHFDNGETFRFLFVSDKNPSAFFSPMVAFAGMSQSAWAVHFSVDDRVVAEKPQPEYSGIVGEIVKNAHLLLQHESDTTITKYNPYLVEVSHLCITNRDKLSMIPGRDAGDVGIAYLHILDLTDASNAQVYPIYSTLSFYFMQKCLFLGNDILPSTEYVKVLEKMIILMNMGAQSFYRTVARAYGEIPTNYFDVTNIYGLPLYVKKILLLELSYFYDCNSEFERNTAYKSFGFGISPEFRQRFGFLKGLENNGYFEEILNGQYLMKGAYDIRKQVFDYANEKISRGDIVFQ